MAGRTTEQVVDILSLAQQITQFGVPLSERVISDVLTSGPSRRRGNVHIAPTLSSREVPVSAQPHIWNPFDSGIIDSKTHDIAQVAALTERFAGKRRVSWDAINGNEQTVNDLAVLPHTRGIARLLEIAGMKEVGAYEIPAEDEARVAAAFEGLLDAEVVSPLQKNRLISFLGLRDGVLKTYAHVAREYGVLDSVINSGIETVAKKLMENLATLRVLPPSSLGRMLGGVMIGDIPVDDLNFNFTSPALGPIGRKLQEAGVRSATDLLLLDLDNTPLLTPADRQTLINEFHNQLPNPDPIGVKTRLERTRNLALLRDVNQNPPENLLVPEIDPLRIARILSVPIERLGLNQRVRAALKRGGIVTLITQDHNTNQAEFFQEAPIDPALPLFELIGAAENQASNRRLTIRDLLRIPYDRIVAAKNKAIYPNAIERKTLDLIKRSVIAYAYRQEHDLQGNWASVTDFASYLVMRREQFLQDPTQPIEILDQIMEAEAALAQQDTTFVASLISADLRRIQIMRTKYEMLLAAHPRKDEIVTLSQRITNLATTGNALQRLDDQLTETEREASSIVMELLTEFTQIVSSDSMEEVMGLFLGNQESNEAFDILSAISA